MTIARLYRMTAGDGQADALLRALTALAETVGVIPDCEGTEILQDRDQPELFLFIEKWVSVEAHKAGGALLPKEAMAPVMAALAGRPEGSYLDYR
ncbi:MAG: antibiotic biosynthesis monooxygenase [Pseudomonadota bacterium]